MNRIMMKESPQFGMYRGFTLMVTIIGNTLLSVCQFYNAGTEPFSTKWEKMEASQVTLIYPKGFCAEAGRLAAIFDAVAETASYSLNVKPKKISVILHTNNVMSNGFVTMAPRRMELSTTPPADNHLPDWAANLALHEYRHVAQITAMSRGMTRALSFLTGQFAYGLVAAQLPLWLIEGDAVHTEDLLPVGGRGRQAGFHMPIRARYAFSPFPYGYDKAYFGSYRHYVPDYYRLGYQLVKYAACLSETNIEQAIPYSAQKVLFPGRMNAFIKRNYGYGLNRFYKNAMELFHKDIGLAGTEDQISPHHILEFLGCKQYSDYRHIQPTDDGYIMLKHEMGRLPVILYIDTFGRERPLHTPGIMADNRISYGGGSVAWCEVKSHVRWEQVSNSVLMLYNLETGKVKQLTHGSRLFSPAVSHDGKHIAVLRYSETNRYEILVLDASDGSQLFSYNPGHNAFLQYPNWGGDDTLLFTSLNGLNKNIHILNIETLKKYVIRFSEGIEIAQPFMIEGNIGFRTDVDGTDNIVYYNLKDSISYSITSSMFGAYDPYYDADNNRIYFTEYTDKGFRPAFILKANGNRVETNLTAKGDSGLAIPVENSYPSIPFTKHNDLIRIHSWAPFYVPPSFQAIERITVQPGFVLYSQNLLGTLTAVAGLAYQNKGVVFRPELTYRGMYPVLNFSMDYGENPRLNAYPDSLPMPALPSQGWLFSANAYIPLSFARGAINYTIRPGINNSFKNITYYQDNQFKRNVLLTDCWFFASWRQRMTSHDLIPRIGQSLYLSWLYVPVGSGQYRPTLYGSVSQYFPGPLKHQALRVNLSGQINYGSAHYTLNRISMPAGTMPPLGGLRSDMAIRSAATFYAPIWYPDLSIPRFIYLKRLHTELFAEWLHLKPGRLPWPQEYRGDYVSYGLALMGELHLFRFLFPVTAGVWVALLPFERKLVAAPLATIRTDIF